MSARIQFSPRQLRRISLAAALVMAAILGGRELWWLYHAKRFLEVREGVLFRTGQPTEEGLRYLIEKKGVRTVISLQTFDARLKRRLYDPGKPDGLTEAEFVRNLNARFEQWPLGDEACWPWPSPWHMEEFFKLLDEPSNRPVLIHCQGGRHRTGTLSALFRLEYDRWPVDQALAEMYSFKFGSPVAWQELNLRTYFPRPRPSAAAWQTLRTRFEQLVEAAPVEDYEGLVLALRHCRDREQLRSEMEAYLTNEGTFVLPLAARLIDAPDDPLASAAALAAMRVLRETRADDTDWAAAAALVADFGDPSQQQWLLDYLKAQPHTLPVDRCYAAIVRGVTNRYTRNRLPFLRPLLDDTRPLDRPGAPGVRYCDVALGRMIGIVDIVFYRPATGNAWEGGRWKALAWFESHASEIQLSRLVPPSGPSLVHAMRLGDEKEGPKRR